MIYHYTDEEYDEAKAFEAGCQEEYEDHCKAEIEAMMPPLEVKKSVRIKIGKKEPLEKVFYHSTGKKPDSDKSKLKISMEDLVKAIADVVESTDEDLSTPKTKRNGV